MDTHESPTAVLEADDSRDVLLDDDNYDEYDSDEDDDNSPDYVPSLKDSGASGYNTIKYNRVIRSVMGCGVSDRDGAKIANSVIMDLVDLDILQFDERLLLTISKIQYQKARIGKVLIKEHEENVAALESIGFDGKKSRTCKENCQVTIEDKITVAGNCGRNYVGSFIPGDGTGEECATGVLEVSFLPFGHFMAFSIPVLLF